MPKVPNKPQGQNLKLVGTVGTCRVFNGDCLAVSKTQRLYDFVFLDPPFNIGQNYKEYHDKREEKEYFSGLCNWVRACANVVHNNGILCLHGPDSLMECYLTTMPFEKEFKRIAWVNWHYRFGQNTMSNWVDTRCHCLIYARAPYKHVWNPQDVLVESDRVAYGDKRVEQCTVVNKAKEEFDVYIGRGSKWGNKFKIGEWYGDRMITRELAVSLYKNWIENSPDAEELRDSLQELQGKRLGCFCKPYPCHGDILVEMVNKLPGRGLRVPGTVWGVPSDGPYWGRVQGNSRERVRACPNQLPERYLERLLRAYTTPQSFVLDPFGGSGTTAVAAQALGRRCDTLDIGLATCQGIVKRLKKGSIRIGAK